MYADHPPVPNAKVEQVLVLELADFQPTYNMDEIIKAAVDESAVSEDGDGDRILWIVFEDDPKRLWDFTEEALRSTLSKRSKELAHV